MRKGVSKYADPKYIGQQFGDRNFAKQQLSNEQFVELCRNVVNYHLKLKEAA